jgi:hypothetical protein
MNSRKNDREKFVVRFSEPGLRAQIASQAKLTKRSMNAEIVYRLFRSFELEEELRRANAVVDRLTGIAPVELDRSEGDS